MRVYDFQTIGACASHTADSCERKFLQHKSASTVGERSVQLHERLRRLFVRLLFSLHLHVHDLFGSGRGILLVSMRRSRSVAHQSSCRTRHSSMFLRFNSFKKETKFSYTMNFLLIYFFRVVFARMCARRCFVHLARSYKSIKRFTQLNLLFRF